MALTPYYDHDGITIYHGDAREIAPELSYDVVVSDPPYGMAWDVNTNRFSGGADPKRRGDGRTGEPILGDEVPFDPVPWINAPQVILWGSNHYSARLPTGTTLVWIKRFDGGYGSFLSDAELAWEKGGHGVYCHRDTSMASVAGRRVHPSQKPLGLMAWCLKRTGSGTVLDPFMGSGTTLRAAKDLGRKAIGIELEEKYCEIAAKRLAQQVFDFGGSK